MGEALAEFVTVRYIAGHEVADVVVERYGIHGFPTLLVLDGDGNEIDEVWGRDPQELREELARVTRGEATLPALRARVAAEPQDFETVALLAQKLSDRRPDEAARLARAALERLGEGRGEVAAELLLALATAEGNLGRPEAAMDSVARVVSEHADTEAASTAVYVIGNNFPSIEPMRGLVLLHRALELADDDVRASMGYVRTTLLRRAWEASMREQALAFAEDAELLNMVAWECFERGLLIDEATEWAERAVRLSDRAPHVLDTLANLHFAADRIDEALKLEAEALMKLPEDDPQRAAYEECFAKFSAVKIVRERRKARGR